MNKTLNIAAVGDLFLNAQTLRDVLAPALPDFVRLTVVQWPLNSLEELQRINLQVEQGGREKIVPDSEVMAAIADADILFTQFWPVSAAVIEMMPRLKVIAVGRSGIENINVEAATQRGIAVLNTVGRNAQAVAEYTIGMMLAEMRNIARGHAALKQGQWRKDYPNDASVPELPGRTLGLVGLGQIGRLVVRKLIGFDMRILAYDPYYPADQAGAIGVELVSLPKLMQEADFISIHAKLTNETKQLLNQEMLSLMKPTAYLINTARAELVDEEALVDMLRRNKIAGAALDVFRHEPPTDDDPILQLDNVTLSPHQAGVTVDAYRTTAKLFRENISRLWNDGPIPANLINPEQKNTLTQIQNAFRSK